MHDLEFLNDLAQKWWVVDGAHRMRLYIESDMKSRKEPEMCITWYVLDPRCPYYVRIALATDRNDLDTEANSVTEYSRLSQVRKLQDMGYNSAKIAGMVRAHGSSYAQNAASDRFCI